MDRLLGRPRGLRRQVQSFDDAELDRLAAFLRNREDSELNARDRAIVALLLDVGLRLSEICARTIEDVEVV